MKKLFAVVLAVALVMALAVTAFAATSPVGEAAHKIYVINGNGTKTEVGTVDAGDPIELKADSAKGEFKEWVVYLMDKTVAVAGKDYTLGAGQTLSSSTITLFPKTDLIITGNYGDKKTEIQIGQNGEPFSPQTGDSVTLWLVGIMLVALSGAVITKKQLV